MARQILTLQDIRKSFGRTEIIRGASVSITEGEIHALIGPNGAGKSTLFHLISRHIPADSGRIVFKGVDISKARPAAIVRMGLKRSFQQTSAFGSMTVAENVAVATMRHEGETGSLLKTSAAMKSVWEKVSETLEAVGLQHKATQRVTDLAYSEQRALEIGLAVAGGPDLILLDEPTAGMSRAETEMVIESIRNVAKGRTLVLIEHDMNVVFGLAQSVSVLVYGQVVLSGSPEVVRGSDEVRQAYLGKAVGARHDA